MAYIVTCDEDRLEFNNWIDDISPFEQAIGVCYKLCYDEIERAYAAKEVTSSDAHKEIKQLNRWYKSIKAEPSKAEIFYVFDKPFVYLTYLKEV